MDIKKIINDIDLKPNINRDGEEVFYETLEFMELYCKLMYKINLNIVAYGLNLDLLNQKLDVILNREEV